jgi:hypothetical protein
VNVFIRQLTGVRFVAAAWVVLYHYQIPLAAVGILTIPGVADVLRVGRLGVDLFFALSGFIITHTYLRRLGPALRARALLDFWWLRLARVYPVHLVMIVIAGTAVVAQATLTGDALTKDWMNPLGPGQERALGPGVGTGTEPGLELRGMVAVDGMAGLPPVPPARVGSVAPSPTPADLGPARGLDGSAHAAGSPGTIHE